MKFKFFLITLIISLGVFAYFAFPIINERYFSTETKKIEIVPQPEYAPETDNGIADHDQGLVPINEPIEQIDATGTPPNIKATDCDNSCQSFKNDVKNLTYCQEVCGLAPVKNDSDCGDKTELEKDYCLKDLGVAKKDFRLCDQIQDDGIKKTCQNRITEDVIEYQSD